MKLIMPNQNYCIIMNSFCNIVHDSASMMAGDKIV